jgi:hypothetical protein
LPKLKGQVPEEKSVPERYLGHYGTSYSTT